MMLLDQLAMKWNPNQKWVLDRTTGGWIWKHSISLAPIASGETNLSIVLLKPNEFMNLNGRSVLKALKKLNVPLSNLILVHDDLERDLGIV